MPLRSAARRLPSNAAAKHMMGASARRMTTHAPVSRPQTRRVPSTDADTACRPSGITATALTQPVCPRKRAQRLAALRVPHSQRVVVGLC